MVDLSQTPSFRGKLGPVHRAILELLANASSGDASRAELLAATEGRSAAETELALRDLSLLGLARVVWRSAFRCVASLTRPGRALVEAEGLVRRERQVYATA